MDASINTFRLNYRIENRSNEEMIIKARGGLGYIIRRQKEPTFRPRRVIHVHIPTVILDNLLIDPKEAFSLFDKELLKKISAERDRIKVKDSFQYEVFSHDINVTISLTTDLVEKNDAIHSEILGITLYASGKHVNQPGINTPSFTIQELCEITLGDQPAPEGGLHCCIYLNDPKCEIGILYTNILGKAVVIPTVSDLIRDPGLYIGVMYGKDSQVTPYYTLDSLDKKTLEALGIFKNKAECEEGSNTERTLAAENKAKETGKELGKAKIDLLDLREQVVKLNDSTTRLTKELAQAKHEHKTEVTMLKHEFKLELSQVKHTAKMTGEMFKYETRMKDTANKANMDFIKQKSSVNNWGEFAKAVGSVATVAFTGYKLFTS